MEHPKDILQRHGLYAKKSLGQNFLHDENLLLRICQAAELATDDEVLEIGPGLGSLTRFLAASAGRVVAVELDGRLMPILRESLADSNNVSLVHQDILDWSPTGTFSHPYKVVSNVPYYITGAILRHLLSASPAPRMVVMTVQQEVAERISASPGNMSLLSVMVQYYGPATVVAKVKAGAFWPVPAVDSALVKIVPQFERRLPPEDEERFIALVKQGFQQRRKQLQKNLRAAGYGRIAIAKAMATAGLDSGIRAQQLSVEDWLALFAALSR
jgi:16S rRNA (adenine1518-N6/adenine1519-N6)-dimethyltransferase